MGINPYSNVLIVSFSGRHLGDCYSDPGISGCPTAKVTSTERHDCLEMGFSEYISKPINYSSFRMMMEKFLANYPEGAFKPEVDAN